MELYSDTYYIDRIQAGDTDCFGCLLDRYGRQVFSLIRKIVENREDAEELTQDVFLKAFRSLSTFNRTCSFSTWIYRIAYNTAISATRKQRREYLSIDESRLENLPEEPILPDGENDEAHRAEKLDAALKQLSPDERALILLFYMEEKTVGEVAEISGISVSNVKIKLFRIRKKLFVLLKELEENA